SEDPENRGRVKVKYPTLSDKDESAWARVVSPGAGPDRGMQLIPETNDEVLVGFEHDDKQRPVIIGGLWNGADYTPKAKVEGGRVNTRIWKSRKEHVIEFDDSDDAAINVSVGESSTTLHLEKSDSKLEAEEKLAIKANAIEITADTTLKLKA